VTGDQGTQLAFMVAAENGHVACVLLLLASGAAVNIANKVIESQGIAALS
jgi:ankyrin repeat protein